MTEHDQTVNSYTGLTRNSFKKRYNGHRYTFNHRDAPNSTTLSTHLWKLTDMNKNYDLKWNILDRAPDFNPVTRKCRLCLKEIFYIMFQPEGATLNKRSELFSTCRHRLRLLLNNTWFNISVSFRYCFQYLNSKNVIVICRWRLWSTTDHMKQFVRPLCY